MAMSTDGYGNIIGAVNEQNYTNIRGVFSLMEVVNMQRKGRWPTNVFIGSVGFQIFSTPGSVPFIVPANVSVIRVQLWGGTGGNSGWSNMACWVAGAGHVKCDIAVTAGEVLDLMIAGGGRKGIGAGNIGINLGGLGGGGNGVGGGSGGGGASWIRRGSLYIAVAPGSGGVTGDGYGGYGGNIISGGNGNCSGGGLPGTKDGPGTGSGVNAGNGSLLQGGSFMDGTRGAGAGSGWFGGGAGTHAAGGGVAYINPACTINALSEAGENAPAGRPGGYSSPNWDGIAGKGLPNYTSPGLDGNPGRIFIEW